MPYCTPQDVRDLHQLLTETDFSDAYITTYINKAVARLNNLLQPHYKVPLVDTVPDIITSITADMAASLLCQHHFSGINYREDTPLADVFRKRAEADLQHVLDHSTLDDYSNVVKREPDVPEMRKRVASTTPQPNPHMQRRKREFDWATQSPLSNVREWP